MVIESVCLTGHAYACTFMWKYRQTQGRRVQYLANIKFPQNGTGTKTSLQTQPLSFKTSPALP